MVIDNTALRTTSQATGDVAASEGHCDKIDLNYLTEICTGLHREHIQSFVGLPIRIDESLRNGYYIVVSRKLFEEIMSPIEGQEE